MPHSITHMQTQRHAACRVDRLRALRFLGYRDQKPSEDVSALLDRAIESCETVSQPAWCYRVFNTAQHGGALLFEGSSLVIPCDGTLEPLVRARACAVMTCTIGMGFEQKALQLSVADSIEALVFDAVGSSLAESCADDCERTIISLADNSALCAGQRTSPGYGSMPLSLSRDIVRVLSADKALGVSVTESDMLVPTKSVTAIVGLFEDENDARRARRSCDECVAKTGCKYRKAGTPC